MKCHICADLIPDERIGQVVVLNRQYSLCGWCEWWLDRFIAGQVEHQVKNITWGDGKVCWNEMHFLREFFKANDITEILEFGAGLSTEIFAIMGMKLVSCDVLENHARMLSQLASLRGIAEVIHYEYGTPPDFDALHPGRKWDFVFVDGPQERSKEVALAMRLSNKFIYLHDPKMGEQSFFPNEEWKGVGNEPKLFIKKGVKCAIA